MKVDELLKCNGHRIDLVIKFLYFKALDTSINLSFFENLYLKHILQRTGGIEPPDVSELNKDTSKVEVSQYLDDAKKLFKSIKENGYDPTFSIPISSRGLILNGAHRLACAKYFGIEDVSVLELPDADLPLKWDFDYLKKDDFFSATELETIAREYVSFYKESSNIAIIYAPALRFEDKITQAFKCKNINVEATFDINLQSYDRWYFDELIYDIYSHDVSDVLGGFSHIVRKLKYLSDYESSLKLMILNSSSEHDLFEECVIIKKNIRKELNSEIEDKKFITIHLSDSYSEKIHIAKTILNENNLKFLLKRNRVIASDDMLLWLSSFNDVLRNYSFTKDDCVIVGSSSLEMIGVRKSTDLDICPSGYFRNKYFNDGVTHINESIDVVTRWYSRRFKDGKEISDDDLIYNNALHFYYRGFKFVIPEVVYERKKIHGRPKDIMDVYLMDINKLKEEGKYFTLLIFKIKSRVNNLLNKEFI